MVQLQAEIRRCGHRAFDGHKLWVCCLHRRHDGDCYATRYDIERAFWEGWNIPEPESVIEPQVIEPEPAPVFRALRPAPLRPAKKKKVIRAKRRRGTPVFAVDGGVKSAVRWTGRQVDYPSLADTDEAGFNW